MNLSLQTAFDRPIANATLKPCTGINSSPPDLVRAPMPELAAALLNRSRSRLLNRNSEVRVIWDEYLKDRS
jgi:hypothetical protein